MAQGATSITQKDVSRAEKWGGGRSPFSLSYGKIMMWFLILSDSFTFGAFLVSYGAHRFFSNVWPDANNVFWGTPLFGDIHMPLVFVSIMTFILILSSVTMVLAVHAGHYGDRAKVTKWLILTIIGGIAFLACQTWEWSELHGDGGWWGTFNDLASLPNAAVAKASVAHFFDPKVAATMSLHDASEALTNFFNYFFTITGFHGFHVSIGVSLLCVALINTAKGTYDKRGHYEMVEKIGLYWHFVDLVWVFVFTSFYLV